MGKCILCEKKGFLIPVSSTGLCGLCSFSLEDGMREKLKIINSSLKIIERSKDTDTIVSVTIIALFHLKEILKVEIKKIESTTEISEIEHPVHDIITKVIQATNEKLVQLISEEYHLLRSFNSDISRNVFINRATYLKNFILDDDLQEIDRMISNIKDKKVLAPKHSFFSEVFSFHILNPVGTVRNTER